MSIDITETSPLERQVDITVSPETVKDESERAFNELRRRVTLKGFRPGKAPYSEIVRRYGKNVRGEVMQTLMQNSTIDALKREDLANSIFVTEPQILEDSGHGGFSFRFRAELPPQVDPTGYLGVGLAIVPEEVTEETIDREIAAMQEEAAIIEPVEDRDIVEPTDLISVSLMPTDPALRTGLIQLDHGMVDLKAMSVVLDLAEQVRGMKVGDTKEVMVKLDADSHPAKVLGVSELQLNVEIHGIKKKVLPDLDDAFAEKEGRVESMAALRDKIRRQKQAQAEREVLNQRKEKLEDYLIEKNPMDIPPAYLQSKIERDLMQKLQRFQQAGLKPEDLEPSMSSLYELVQHGVNRRIRLDFILKAIADRERVAVDPGEVDAMIADLVRGSGSSAVKMQQAFNEPGRRAMIEEQMRLDKTLDFLLSKTTLVTEGSNEAAEAPAAGATGAAGEAADSGPGSQLGGAEPAGDGAKAD